MHYSIADLHCDLLCFLQGNPSRSAYDPIVRCSIPQLRQGHVKMQTMAVFAETAPDSLAKGMAQLNIYQLLPTYYPKDFRHATYPLQNSDKIALMLAFEGASTFCDEQEPIKKGLKRIQGIINSPIKPLYISLTWNQENRFGGGAHTDVGLKGDGRCLLDLLHATGVAIDLSHASDALAEDILCHIDKYKLQIPMMASHSNYRSVMDVPRNLPDALVQEIARRKGVIGLNFYRPFVGVDAERDLVRHLQRALELGGEDSIAFGADFFYDGDLPTSSKRQGELFFQEYGNASCYPKIMELFQTELGLSGEMLEKLSHGNVMRFIDSHSKKAFE